jgi:hypothetical protein
VSFSNGLLLLGAVVSQKVPQGTVSSPFLSDVVIWSLLKMMLLFCLKPGCNSLPGKLEMLLFLNETLSFGYFFFKAEIFKSVHFILNLLLGGAILSPTF